MFLRKFTVLIILLIGGLIIITTVYAADSVTAPSLNSSYGVVDTATRALLPRELYETPTPKPIQVGVQKSFFDLGTLKSLICWLNSDFCPKNLDLSSGKTQDFVDKSTVLIQSQRPLEIQPNHLQQDIRLQDNAEKGAL